MSDDGDPFFDPGTSVTVTNFPLDIVCALWREPMSLTMPGVTIHFDPPRVEVDTGLSWDGAAKMFWNEVARIAGQPPPFGW